MRLEKGNLLDSHLYTQVIPVNCRGIAGKGLALAWKKRYPGLYQYYYDMCSPPDKTLFLGCPQQIVRTEHTFIMFPTKNHWANQSDIFWIQRGLVRLAKHYLYGDSFIESPWAKPTDMAFPPLGCGLGGLQNSAVLPLIQDFENITNISCTIYSL